MTLPAIFACLTFLLRATEVRCQIGDEPPPTMFLSRSWKLNESTPVGTEVERVIAESHGLRPLTFGLEPSSLNYHSSELQRPLPFAINQTTGVISLNETLKGRGGQSITLYVTVSDGHLPAKTEVFVNIDGSDSKTGQTRSPYLGQHEVLRQQFGRQPPPPPPSWIKQHQQQQQAVLVPARTKLQPEIAAKPSPGVEELTTSEAPALSSKAEPSEAPPGPDLAITLVSVAGVCALLLGLGMTTWSLRRRICPTSISKASKENSTVSVSTVSNSSLDLKRWRSPKVHNNRYEAWGSESKANSRNKRENRDDKWEFPRHRLKVFNILGEGCFGQVWKCEAIDIGVASGTTIVAVKTLKENASERERLDLAQELKVMKSLEPHPNVVRLLGCCTEREPMFVILEYVSGGKLQSFLRASREERNQGGPGLTSRDLTSFVYQVAKGMEYLASKGIIHRDLAARNVLIDDNRVCKVADFGFARDVAANQIYERKSEGRLPIRWMAPESLYDNIFSVKSDIWSFGVLIWEIVTLGSTPYPGLAAAEVMRRIKEGYRLDRPEHCKRELYNIMYYCWDKDPACRPSFPELVNLAEGLLLDETDYIELDRFPDHSYYNVLNLSGEKL